ncbi:MAG: hypothetical protein H0U76_04005 [Ktedonobacteraceae bacterium]|nr:hypothetical protein [Ktedonobacteraceae bacterium]
MEIREQLLSDHLQVSLQQLQELVRREPDTMEKVLLNQAVAGMVMTHILMAIGVYLPDEINEQVRSALDLHRQVRDQFPTHKKSQEQEENL